MSKPCRFYLQGYCKNGRYCRFNHQSVTRDQRGLATKTITNTRNGEWERKQEYEKHTGSQRNLIERSRDYENRAGMGERRRTQADSERNKERTASYEATKLSKIEERSMKGSDERLGKERSGKLNLQEPVKERETWRVREDRKHWGNERGVNNSVEHVSRDDGRVDSYNICGIQSAVQTFCKQVDKQNPPTQAAVSTALSTSLRKKKWIMLDAENMYQITEAGLQMARILNKDAADYKKMYDDENTEIIMPDSD
ncbi:uncharacterized protein LOC111710830 isoform X4 [Eurytemora carolleeae]|uniref:uncharacterized protein LOC111710830 isoform X4 n=1 Tax=Eurytemora carolleeae TaxID=1294199 RepID=UPI000C76AC88|nr:uncharacterized protein LOC111710830 isoform X4 [Eurytemora carolleeae]|eukprot:XP_023340753.1 uncharacterized protein LOC111710830 isoform X4 [Eurytemora affinis]